MKDIFEIEILKLKRSKILWIITIAPIFMVLQGALNLLRYYDLFTGKGQNVWGQLYTQSMIFYASILFPILINIVMTLIARIENTNDNWKHYLCMPIDRGMIYGIKFLIGCIIIFINIVVLIFSIILAGRFIGFEGSFPYKALMTRAMFTYMAALPIMAILYVLSIRFNHMAIPLSIGIGLTLPAMIVANSRFWIFYPWTYPIMAALGGDMEIFNKGSTIYVASFIQLITILSFGYNGFIKEYNLLLYLSENPNQILSKNKILEHVWGYDYEGYDNTLMVHIRHLRQKLEDDPSNPKHLITVKGLSGVI